MVVMEEIIAKWQGKEYKIPISDADTVGDLKQKLYEQTQVLPKRQKLLGLKLKGGKPASDDCAASQLAAKAGQKSLQVMMMGTVEKDIEDVAKQAQNTKEPEDDFDIQEGDSVALSVKDQPDVQEKLQKRIQSVKVNTINPPRPGKKLLVLDIDYTIFDLKSTAERAEELARPYMHEMLARVYPFYDIMIWSATSMKWVQVKMQELGVLSHPEYKVVCLLDEAPMVPIYMQWGASSKERLFNCKPLQFIWGKFEEYNESNTIMFDDLRRNYVMNPQNGLVIAPYKSAHVNRGKDKELYYLTQYLLKIAELESLSSLDHSQWRAFIRH